MEQIKRQRSNSFDNYDDNKRNKIQMTSVKTNDLSGEIITHFEDLSNDVMYEIFEFLDYFHAYEAFYNLNLRFRSLLTNSSLPIKINILPMSKLSYNRYNTDIIIPNKHRIKSLHLSNFFMYDTFAFSLLHETSEFGRLETLILYDIESNYLENLLHQLTSLPILSSLIITSVDQVRNIKAIYRQIFSLSALKYCKLSLKRSYGGETLAVATNESSPIEQLIIDNDISLHELNSLLSYVPQLRHLSLRSLYKSWGEQTKICSIILNHLTHLSLKPNYSIKFDDLEKAFRSLFPMVQVLWISADSEYMNANRWEQLILSYIPNLRIFDIRLEFSLTDNIVMGIENQFNQFTSSFWIERQWFFEYRYYHPRYRSNGLIFYSTNPYRRKRYILCKQQKKTTCLSDCQIDLKSVDSVQIEMEKEMINCGYYFSNATKVTFEDSFSITRASIATILTRIMPLKQLTNLIIECHHLPFIKVIELLRLTPNIHTLIFQTMPLYTNKSMLIEQSEIFRLVSSTNTIKNVTFKQKCTLEKVKLLVALCPQVQHLTINTLMKDMESMIQFLLERTNQNTSHLVSLWFLDASSMYFRNLNALVDSRTLPRHCVVKHVDSKLYLWW